MKRVNLDCSPGIRHEEFLHRRGVAGNNHDEPIAIILHRFQQSVDRLVTISIAAGYAARSCQRICLVDEQNTAERLSSQPPTF